MARRIHKMTPACEVWTIMRYKYYRHTMQPCGSIFSIIMDQSRYVPSQWEMSLQCNNVSHWLGVCLDWSMMPRWMFALLTNTSRVWEEYSAYGIAWCTMGCICGPWHKVTEEMGQVLQTIITVRSCYNAVNFLTYILDWINRTWIAS